MDLSLKSAFLALSSFSASLIVTSTTRFLFSAARFVSAPNRVVTRASPIQNTTSTFTVTPYHR